MKRTSYRLLAAILTTLFGLSAARPVAADPVYLSPSALAASPDGQLLFIACATADQVALFDIASGKITKTVPVPATPTGLALSQDGARLYVTCGAPVSRVCLIDTREAKVIETIPAGHTAMGPVLAPDGKTLFVCNRFNNDVSQIDLEAKKEVRRVSVQREPVAAALTPDGKFLLVANHLHSGRADVDHVAAVVSVIEVAAGKVVKELTLPNGSGVLNDIRVSPDGKHACVTHILARFHLPTTQLERGWMNTNAKTIIDLARMEVLNTVLLDNVDRGAANPWGLAWTSDSKTIVATHAGTHEISVIDFPALLAKLAKLPAPGAEGAAIDYSAASRTQADVPNDLSFLVGVRLRLRLTESDHGPQAVVAVASKVYVANYYSDTLSVIDLAAPAPRATSISLGPKQELTQTRRGELLFHDASICFQGWQSCASCHPGNARVDGLNWDLLNDGIGNPKNNRSMLLTHKTPPAMSIGVRETAETAVRAGIQHILFTVQPEEVPTAIDVYLKSLQPVPSPQLVDGQLSPAAQRGRDLFQNEAVGCATCHPSGLFTDLKSHDVGTQQPLDKGVKEFDNPTLVEVWRTAPYLHDGSAATLRDVLTTRNPKDAHGKTSHLTPQQIDDLTQYVLSL